MGFYSGGGVSNPGGGGGGGAPATNIIDKQYRIATNGSDTRADVAADRYDQLKPWATLQGVFTDINVNTPGDGIGIKIAPGSYAGGSVNMQAPGGVKIEAEVGGSVTLTSGILLQGDGFSAFEIRGVNAQSTGHCIDGGSTVVSTIRIIDCNLLSISFNEECLDINGDLVEVSGGSIQQVDSGSGAEPRRPIKITTPVSGVSLTLVSTRIGMTSQSNTQDASCIRFSGSAGQNINFLAQSVSFQIGRLGSDVQALSSLARVRGTTGTVTARLIGCQLDVGVNNPNGQNPPSLELFEVTNTTGTIDIKASSTQVNWRGIAEADVYTSSMDNASGAIALLDTAWLDMTTDTFPGRRSVGADAGSIEMEGVNNFGSRTP